MIPRVLILSSLYDFSADLVALRLRDRETPFLRLNREHLRDYRLTLDPVGGTLEVQGDGIRASVGEGLASVWFRQPVFLRNTPARPLSPEEQLDRSQWSAFERALSLFEQVAWMNYPQATYLAECKPHQLRVASRCGFRIPRTIVTNDAEAIKSCFSGQAALKSMDTVLLKDGEDCLFAYTRIADAQELTHEATAAVPLIAQEFLRHKTDLRVTVVGDAVFAVQVLGDGRSIEGDWRVLPKERLSYPNVALDAETRFACLRLRNELGLAFAAIDLAVTPDGVFFIEVNPTGEWGWLSCDARPIDETIAVWLTNPTTIKKLAASQHAPGGPRRQFHPSG